MQKNLMRPKSMHKVPFLDIKKIHSEFQEDINKSVSDVVNSGNYLLNKELFKFEDSYADYENVNEVIGVGSGLDALKIILLSLKINKGDEIIVPAHTFIATWLAVSNIGAIPVPIEPDENTFNIDVNLIESAVTSKTKAIIVVNLYGQVADLEPIRKICDNHNLFLVEDGAQSHGAKYKDIHTSSISDAVATSFYPGKNLGCMGDGGAILTNNNLLASEARRIRNYGSEKKYEHLVLGLNSRLDELQASILNVKLKHLKEMNSKRSKIADFYNTNLLNRNLVKPKKINFVDHVWHLYVIRSRNRDKLMQRLLEVGIQTIIHYPIPPHLQKCYEYLSLKNFKLTERICSEILSLPLYPNMPEEDYYYVTEMVNKFSNN